MWKLILIFLLFLRFSVSKLVGSCNQCFASNKVACLNENQFSTCFHGSVTPTVTTCPDKHVCTDDVLICRPTEAGYRPICWNEYCGQCEITNGVFACVDKTTYGYCFGAKTPLESTLRSCPSGFVCNYNYRDVCVRETTNLASCDGNATDSTTAGTTVSTAIEQISTTTQLSTVATQTTNAATTNTEETTLKTKTKTTQRTTPKTETTSMPHPQDANSICELNGRTGYFKSPDATCRQYVYCYLLAGQYLGLFYYCDFYFNDATQNCQKERPPNCVAY